MSRMGIDEELADMIARANPDAVVAFRPSDAARARVADLIRREKTGVLSADERSELEHSLEIEHLMRLAKARARLHLRENDE
jgi:hypothetical protein